MQIRVIGKNPLYESHMIVYAYIFFLFLHIRCRRYHAFYARVISVIGKTGFRFMLLPLPVVFSMKPKLYQRANILLTKYQHDQSQDFKFSRNKSVRNLSKQKKNAVEPPNTFKFFFYGFCLSLRIF